MKKLICSIFCLFSFSLFGVSSDNDGEVSNKESMLSQIESIYSEHFSEEDFQTFRLGHQYMITKYRVDYEDLCNFITDKMIEAQGVIFKYAEQNKELVENGSLILQDKSLDRDSFFHLVTLLIMGYIQPDHPDCEKYQRILYEYNIKDDILISFLENSSESAIEEVDEILLGQRYIKCMEIFKDSEDAQFQAVYNEFGGFKTLDEMEEHKLFKCKHFDDLSDGVVLPIDPLEKEFVSVLKEIEERIESFSNKMEQLLN